MPNISELFKNVKEVLEPVVGKLVEGSIPGWLEGSIYRVGPGIFDLDGGFTVNYYFDGFAIIVKVEIKKGEVTFSQRMLESTAYTKANLCKRPVYAEFGTRAYPDSTKNIFKRLLSTLVPTDLTDNNVCNIYKLEDEIITASETCFVHSIHSDSLSKKEKLDYSKYLPNIMLLTSHPMTDSEGVTWNIGSQVMPTCKYHIMKIPPTGDAKKSLTEGKIIATIDSTSATSLTYQHSFTMTKNYIIFMEQPLTMSIIKMAQMGIKGNSVKDAFEWNPEHKNRMYIIEKETGKVLKTHYLTDKAYLVLHYVNAYEENDDIVIDALTYPSAEFLEKQELKKLRNNEYSGDENAQFNRFVLPVVWDVKHVTEGMNLVNSESPYTALALTVRKGDKIIATPQPFYEPGIEFPVVNPANVGKPYRYFYASGIYSHSSAYKNSIFKVDNETTDVKIFKVGDANDFPGEVHFVPRGLENDDEDEGVVLTCVVSSVAGRAPHLLIMDGKNFDKIAKIEFPNVEMAQTLHGFFQKSKN